MEMNTVFQQLTNVLEQDRPSQAEPKPWARCPRRFSGRGEAMGQSLSDFDAVLKKIEPSLPNLTGDIEAMAAVSKAYGDAAPDLLRTVDNTQPDERQPRGRAAEPRQLPGRARSAWPTPATTSSAATGRRSAPR